MIKIITSVITHFSQNCRFLIDESSRQVIVIDPGGEVDLLARRLSAEETLGEFDSVRILLTHAHIDHGGAVMRLQDIVEEKRGERPLLYFHKDNDLYRETLEQQVAFFGLPRGEYYNVPEADAYLDEESDVSLGEQRIKVLLTPGHAPGHLSFFFENSNIIEEVWPQGETTPQISKNLGPFLIGGDALFRGSIGRTDLPGGNHQELIDSIESRLMVLPEETLVLSGHGSNTTIGFEKENNPFLV
jgi:hydroxyacylglutathione hydrolase